MMIVVESFDAAMASASACPALNGESTRFESGALRTDAARKSCAERGVVEREARIEGDPTDRDTVNGASSRRPGDVFGRPSKEYGRLRLERRMPLDVLTVAQDEGRIDVAQADAPQLHPDGTGRQVRDCKPAERIADHRTAKRDDENCGHCTGAPASLRTSPLIRAVPVDRSDCARATAGNTKIVRVATMAIPGMRTKADCIGVLAKGIRRRRPASCRLHTGLHRNRPKCAPGGYCSNAPRE
jgi:hypothetical protein